MFDINVQMKKRLSLAVSVFGQISTHTEGHQQFITGQTVGAQFSRKDKPDD